MRVASARTLPANPLKVRDRVRARQIIGAEVERLIAYLDAIDGDPDLEETGDDEPGTDEEPLLGSFDRMLNQEHAYRLNEGSWTSNDCELDDCDDEDGADREPSLGAPELGASRSQEAWSRGACDDREEAVPVDPAFRRGFAEAEREADHARAAARRLREIVGRLNGAPANGSNLLEVW